MTTHHYPTGDCEAAWARVSIGILASDDEDTSLIEDAATRTLDDCRNRDDWWAGAEDAEPEWAATVDRGTALLTMCQGNPFGRVCLHD